MHIPCGYHGLAQFFPETDNNTVKVLQVLHGAHFPLTQHKHVVADRLDLQIIIKRSDALEFVPAFMLDHRLKQFARFAGGANDQTFAPFYQLCFWNNWLPLEIFEIRQGNQLVHIVHAQLVLGQNDHMPGPAVGLAQRAEFEHFLVDFLDSGNPTRTEHIKKGRQHIAHRRTVIAGAMMVESGQFQPFGHHIQLKMRQLRQQVLSQDQ